MILNVTNGDYFNNYLQTKTNQKSIPFAEVMMDGNATKEIFSNEFIKTRSNALNASENDYIINIKPFYDLVQKSYDEIRLWFGLDTFCQINLLTLLTYFEQINYTGKIFVNYIDDETFNVIEKDISINLGIYKKIYNDVLISRLKPSNYGVLNKKAIDLYFDYHSSNGKLAKLVKENKKIMSNEDLVVLLLINSKEYGLSDVQAKNLINLY